MRFTGIHWSSSRFWFSGMHGYVEVPCRGKMGSDKGSLHGFFSLVSRCGARKMQRSISKVSRFQMKDQETGRTNPQLS
jgi:hypothetical protein